MCILYIHLSLLIFSMCLCFECVCIYILQCVLCEIIFIDNNMLCGCMTDTCGGVVSCGRGRGLIQQLILFVF